ncbi:hypothetical protein [Granulicella sp. L46]|uniref:hypothetical protein n=1 Tax=Granulicella sp. L46 TaxID=1641865 RepID=UPI00131C6EA9|nr:hypothetical protein [Granulicella sp. L46]
MNAHEEGFVRSFVVASKRERVAMLLANPKRRKEYLKTLAHYCDLEVQHAKAVLPKVAHTPDEWLKLLRSKGAPEKCWVISEDASKDAKEVELSEALRETIGAGMGTVLSCVAGKLGYFEDEDQRRLLER